MLNYEKLFVKLKHADHNLFTFSHAPQKLLAIWKQLCVDDKAANMLKEFAKAQQLASWHENIGDTFKIADAAGDYTVISVDGSQIYPDRHEGSSCTLINTGTTRLTYCAQQGYAYFASEPYIYTVQDYQDYPMPWWVDAQRYGLELEDGYTASMIERKRLKHVPILYLIDGSLLFWHLKSKERLKITEYFVQWYISLLEKFYQERIYIAGYTSCPQSRSLIQILCYYNQIKNKSKCIDKYMLDVHIISAYVSTYERTIIFTDYTNIANWFPEHLRPCFIYIKTPHEIVRLEAPQWLIQDNVAFDQVCAMIINQIKKGAGYPVVLAEAHQQAVITEHDRMLFYRMIDKIGEPKNLYRNTSKKLNGKKYLHF